MLDVGPQGRAANRHPPAAARLRHASESPSRTPDPVAPAAGVATFPTEAAVLDFGSAVLSPDLTSRTN